MKTNLTPTPAPSNGPTRNPYPFLERGENQFAITINRPPEDVYAFWRDLRNLTAFMKDLSEIVVMSPTHSKWTITLSNGSSTSWEADIVADVPGESISWESADDSSVDTAGTVAFAPAPNGRGTVVSLTMDYSVPGGKLTELLTLFTGEDPKHLIQTNLKRLKAYLETGEIPTTEGQPSGREPDNVRH